MPINSDTADPHKISPFLASFQFQLPLQLYPAYRREAKNFTLKSRRYVLIAPRFASLKVSEMFSPKVMQGLAKSITWDGEGATCLIEVTVTGAKGETEAGRIARSVAASSLLKAAVHGRDQNWRRIAAAAGCAGISFDPNNLQILLGDIVLMDGGQPLKFDRVAARNYLIKAGETHGTVEIKIAVAIDGPGFGKAWGVRFKLRRCQNKCRIYNIKGHCCIESLTVPVLIIYNCS